MPRARYGTEFSDRLLATLTLAVPAQAAQFSIDDDTALSIYGSLEPKLINETGTDGQDSLELDDEDSTLGVRAEHRFGAGYTAFGQIEVELSSDTGDNGSGGAFDEQDSAFAGLAGGFGKVRAGNFDNVYEDLIIDATEVAEDAEISDEAFAGEDNQIAYYSPSFGGFSFRTQVRVQGEDELNGTDITQNGVGAINDADNEVGIAGTFNAAPVELAAKFAVQENRDNAAAGDHTTFSSLRATYDYGRGTIYPAVQQISPDDADDRTELTIGADYRVFSNLELWSELGRFDRRNGAGDNFMVGAILSF